MVFCILILSSSKEKVKGVLRWLLGRTFDFMPHDVIALLQQNGSDLKHGIAIDETAPNVLGLTMTNCTTVVRYQNMVKFINEAIDWESALFSLFLLLGYSGKLGLYQEY